MLNKTGVIIRLLAFLLLAVLLFSFTISALADTTYTPRDYDYSRPSSDRNTTISGTSIISDYLGIDLSEVEAKYLDSFASVNISYNDTITTAYVLTDYVDTTLNIVARPYSYLAKNGTRVTWIPTTATFADVTTSITNVDGKYTASFTGVTDDPGAELSIKYTISFAIPADDINHLINQAYNDAIYWIDEIPLRVENSIKLQEEYDANLISYEEYLAKLAEYESKYAVYTEYLKAKKIYDEKLGEYNAYLDDLAAYNAAIENNKNLDILWEEYYKNYALYLNYLEEVSAYERELLDYQAYLKKIEGLQAQLSAIEATAIAMTDGRKVYDAIMGNMVTKVLANKDLIANSLVGAAEEVVDAAGAATDSLRVLLPHYFSLKTFEERYTYYAVNYTAFRDSFSLLLRSLDNLYRNAKVRGYLISQSLDRKYVILVAQLAYVANALSDTPIYSYYKEYSYEAGFTIENMTVPEILEGKEYLIDTGNAAPDPDGYPPAREEPKPPTPLEEPKKPGKVEVPAYPDEVLHPGDAPDVVDEPLCPEEKLHPGIRPEIYSAPSEVLALVDAYERGELSPRTSVDSVLVIDLERTVTKKPFDPNKVTVSFYDYEGGILEAVEIERGSIADYTGEVPTRKEDQTATYEFAWWVDSKGERPDFTAVETDLDLYPYFTATPKVYNVTFRVGESETVIAYPYGSMPEFTGVPFLSHDETFIYAFKSWDKKLVPVQNHVTYNAVFENQYILPYKDGGGATMLITDDAFIVDAVGSSVPIFDLTSLVDITAHTLGKEIVLNTRFGTVKIPFSVATEMYQNGDTRLSIDIIQVSSYGYRYKVDVKGSDDTPRATYKLSLVASYGELVSDGIFYRLDENGDRQYVKNTKEDGKISFTLNTGMAYSYIIERSVAKLDSSLVTIATTTGVAHPGDTVYVTTKVALGADLLRVYYVTDDGREVDIVGGKFIMPNEDVTVLTTAKLKEYKITFKDSRQVIAVYTYKYGDTVIPPKDPSKVADAVYSYTFIGWRAFGSDTAADIPPVTGDATYTAVYSTKLVPKPVDDGSLKISPGILRLLIAGAIALVMIVVVVIPSLIISIVFFVRIRRMYKRKK